MQKNKWEIGRSKMRSLFIRILYAEIVNEMNRNSTLGIE